MRGARTIEVAGQRYRWRVGRRHVAIRAPDGTQHAPEIPELKGCPWPEIERARRLGQRAGAVTPADVRRWILRRLHRPEDAADAV